VDQIRKKLLELVDSEETIYRVTKPWKKAPNLDPASRLKPLVLTCFNHETPRNNAGLKPSNCGLKPIMVL
jgi:hypothetical protein